VCMRDREREREREREIDFGGYKLLARFKEY
jgi:hypothetical protein